MRAALMGVLLVLSVVELGTSSPALGWVEASGPMMLSAYLVYQCGLSAEVAGTEQYIRVGGREWKSEILVQNGQESFALDVKIINLDYQAKTGL